MIFRFLKPLCCGVMLAVIVGCAATPGQLDLDSQNRDPDSLLIVDCLLPGQVRQLGTRLTYQSPRRPVKSTAASCEIRGGEYVAYDRANFSTALKIWLPRAKQGDAEAQTYVGEIYEKGMGLDSDYGLAAQWYRKAAEQRFSRAMINLGYLYETGLGVEKDLTTAMNYYRDASGITDGDLEYVSSVEFAKRVAAREETAALREQVVQLQEDLASSEARYLEEQNKLASQKQSLASLKQEIEQQKQVVLDANQQSEKDSTSDFLQQIDVLQNQLAIAKTEEGNLTTALAARREQNTQLRRQYADANRELVQVKKRLDQREMLISELKTSSSSVAQDEKAENVAKLDAYEQEVLTLREELAALEANNSDTQSELALRLRDAERQEQAMARQLDQKADVVAQLQVQQMELEKQYAQQIERLQSQLLAGRAEQLRLTDKLSAANVSAKEFEENTAALQEELKRQVQAVALREEEQKRLTEKYSKLQLSNREASEQRTQLRASLKESESELAAARLEQTRLTNRLLSQQVSSQKVQLQAELQLAVLEGELAEREAEIELQNEKLTQLETDVSRARAQLNESPREQIAQVVASGPLIDIINPPVLATRGAPTLPARQDGSLELIGKVDPANNLLTFNINGQSQALNTAGVFKYISQAGAESVELVAVDQNGADTRLKLMIDAADPGTATAQSNSDAADEPPLDGIEFGKYYALIVGNNNYASLSDLNTAENDAKALDRILREKYGFQTELLLNATRVDLLSALNRLQETLTPNDNLLVYYAGHGELDKVNQRGYWLPVDADANNTENWVSNSAISDYLDTMAAKHILVIADSCYSGTMTRSSLARKLPNMTPDVRRKWLNAITQSKVRAVLSSGGVKPVYDGSANAKHSLFAEVFIDELNKSPTVLEGYSLFFNLQQRVNIAAEELGVEQNPQYSPIKHAGHEAGEFLFVPTQLQNL